MALNTPIVLIAIMPNPPPARVVSTYPLKYWLFRYSSIVQNEKYRMTIVCRMITAFATPGTCFPEIWTSSLVVKRSPWKRSRLSFQVSD